MLKFFVFIVITTVSLACCSPINVYQQQRIIPNFEWDKSNVLTYSYINDNAITNKKLFLALRHTNNYPYNNMWVRLIATNGTTNKVDTTINVPLTRNNANQAWAGLSMDDIVEIYCPISTFVGDKGLYTFTLQQVMRVNPLPQVISVGMRIENAP